MNETVTLPQLIARLAAESGCTPAVARKFLHDLFVDIEQTLAEGKNITVPGIGEFAPGIDHAHPVLFRPDAALAAALNEPFEAFSAVELPADVPLDLSEPEAETADRPADESPSEITEPEEPAAELPEEGTDEPADEPAEEPVTEPEAETSEQEETQPEAAVEEAPAPVAEATTTVVEEPAPVAVPADEIPAESAPEPAPEPEEPEEPELEPAPARSAHTPGMWLTCGILIGLILGLVGGYFAGEAVGRYHIPDESEEEYNDEADTTLSVAEETPAPVAAQQPAPAPEEVATAPAEATAKEPAAEQPKPAVPAPQPAKEPVYDTITSTQFLTTLARKHYGVKNYWIFIYEANPALGNPNNIRPGTRVMIPERTSFEEATPEATKAKAQQHLNALARKYKL